MFIFGSQMPPRCVIRIPGCYDFFIAQLFNKRAVFPHLLIVTDNLFFSHTLQGFRGKLLISRRIAVFNEAGQLDFSQTRCKIIFFGLPVLFGLVGLEKKKCQAVDQNKADGDHRQITSVDFSGYRDDKHKSFQL